MKNNIKNNFVDTVGNTPLIKLKKASEITGCDIYGKAEFLNPGSSIKDRAAKGIVLDAIEKKQLLPGGIIVEGTAGNTGIGLGLVGNSLGYKTLIVMPETQSQEKKDALRLIGCELKLVPALPYSNPGNYIRQSQQIAEDLSKTHENGFFGPISLIMLQIKWLILILQDLKYGNKQKVKLMLLLVQLVLEELYLERDCF